MPLGKLIYLPEESAPTIATEGNREAVAYLELSEHTDYYGRIFANAPELLTALCRASFLLRRIHEGDHNAFGNALDCSEVADAIIAKAAGGSHG